MTKRAKTKLIKPPASSKSARPKTQIIPMPQRQAQLVLALLFSTGETLELFGAAVYDIGRRDLVNGWDPAVDLSLYGGEARGVSRKHAQIRIQNEQPLLVDLGSSNSTFVDGIEIGLVPHPLFDGNELKFGRLRATIRIEKKPITQGLP